MQSSMTRAYLAVWRAWERALWGGRLRQRVLTSLLKNYYLSKYRREWLLSEAQPHFFDHRMTLFTFAFTDNCSGPAALTRAFVASEVIRDGDRLLDIGCGDGFFTRRFLAPRCSIVDAIDIEPSAIASATIHNSAPHINYLLQDATVGAFPRKEYDVIVWDGAVGHFAAATLHAMLAKIGSALAEDGVFVGSESLGNEGHDHLQFFEDLDALAHVLSTHFPFVELREAKYQLGDGFVRREAYWRCALKADRLDRHRWRRFAENDLSQLGRTKRVA